VLERSRRIKILIPIRHPIGGIRTYLKYTYGSLSSHRFDLTLLFHQDYKTEKDTLSLLKDLEGYRLNVVIGNGKHALASLFNKVFLLLKSNKFDLIHSQGTTCGIIVSLVNTFFGVPHIITLHETFDEPVLGTCFLKFKRELISVLLGKADLINVVSKDARENLLNVFPRLKNKLAKIVVIPNGVDVDYFRGNISNAQNIHDIPGITEKDFVIGYLGRYMPEKGFPVLMDAMKVLVEEFTMRSVKVLCLGWGAFIREYQAYIRGNGLENFFVFLEFQNDVRWILRGIDLVVIPSLREASPLVPMEALVSGAPVVASNCVGLREVLKNTPSRMAIPGDPRDLARKISEVIDSYPHVKREFTEYIPIAVRRFDSKRSATKLEKLIVKLVSEMN